MRIGTKHVGESHAAVKSGDLTFPHSICRMVPSETPTAFASPMIVYPAAARSRWSRPHGGIDGPNPEAAINKEQSLLAKLRRQLG